MEAEFEIRSRTGRTVLVDRSEEACKRFGVVPDQTIFHLERNCVGTVIGVGPATGEEVPGPPVLWVKLEKDCGLTYVVFPNEFEVIH